MGALMSVRLCDIISIYEPLQLISTVDEHASLFAIWKSINGLSVYGAPEQSPYAMAFFNVLFYKAYALWAAFWLSALSLPDAWLPTVCRVLTLLGSLTGWLAMTLTLHSVQNKISAGKVSLLPLFPAFAASVLFIGPMTGFWSLTVRPDVWAVVFEIIAVAFFLRYYATRKQSAVLLAFVFLMITWLVKQPSVSVAGGIGLFLLFERQWRLLVIYSTLFIIAWALVLYFGTDAFRGSILLSRIHLDYSVTHAAKVWLNGLSKTTPLFIPLAAIFITMLMSPAFRTRFMDSWVCRFFLIAFSASVVVVSILCLQIGSEENYLFPSVFLAAGLLVAGYAALPRQSAAMTVINPVLIGAAAIQTLLCGLVLSGNVSTVDSIRKFYPNWIQTTACINKLPKPLFVGDKYLSLPWMTDSAEPFVLSFTYERARAQDLKLEKGGIGGRINSGEFSTLVIPNGDRNVDYDGADLNNYILQPGKCGSLFIWSRKSD